MNIKNTMVFINPISIEIKIFIIFISGGRGIDLGTYDYGGEGSTVGHVDNGRLQTFVVSSDILLVYIYI
jgi:hypothetical protein